jgi:hypothetical protein
MTTISVDSEVRGDSSARCQFQALRRFALDGTDHASHAQQDAAIHAYLHWHNRNARPAKTWRLNAEVHLSLLNVAA